MSKAGKILVGLTAVFALFMLCMAPLGGALLFITNSSSSNIEVVYGIGVALYYAMSDQSDFVLLFWEKSIAGNNNLRNGR